MKKPTLIFFTFLILLANVATQYINEIRDGSNIDSEGNQVFEIIIALAKPDDEPFEFEMTLQNSAGDEIKATCSFYPLETEEGEIPENEKEKEEKEKEPENEKGKAEKEIKKEIGKPENEKEKGKTENEKEKAENEKEKEEKEKEKEKKKKNRKRKN